MTPGFQDEEVLGKVYDWRLVRRLWPFLSPYKGLLWLSLLLVLPRAVVEAMPGLIVAVGLNHLAGGAEFPLAGLARLEDQDWIAGVFSPPAGIELIPWLAVLLFGVSVMQGMIELARMLAMAVMGQRAMRDLRRELFGHVQRLPMRFFDRYPVGRLVTRLTNDVESLAEMFSSGAVALITDLFLMLFFGVLLFTIHPKLAAVAMAVMPVMAVAAIIFRYKVRQAFREVRIKIARINAHLQETISGMKIVQLFAREARNLRDFSAINADHRDSWYRSIRYDALLFSTIDVAQNLAMTLILWYGASLVGAGEIEPGLLYIFVDWMRKFFRPLADLSQRYSVMQSAMASCERMFQLADVTPEQPDVRGAAVPAVRGEVVFENVTFGYGDTPVLRDVSMRVAPGERVALVGHTGAGKTTLLKLLSRLYDFEQGAIRVDGVDIREWPRTELRRHISYVLQDVFLFDGDLRYNVGLGRPDIPAERIEQAARTTHVDALVERLPHGWSQSVRERGVNFSTGERQLLSFARALARAPEILLLDEATANVDTATEALIQDALRRLMEGKTSIVVAHRLSTIQDVDRIYVMHHGQIREVGSHEELLQARGLYWKLYQLQYAAQSGDGAVDPGVAPDPGDLAPAPG